MSETKYSKPPADHRKHQTVRLMVEWNAKNACCELNKAINSSSSPLIMDAIAQTREKVSAAVLVCVRRGLNGKEATAQTTRARACTWVSLKNVYMYKCLLCLAELRFWMCSQINGSHTLHSIFAPYAPCFRSFALYFDWMMLLLILFCRLVRN